ncbi:hypothetical protein B0H16DRAFT_1896163, partial [Mycena metata]
MAHTLPSLEESVTFIRNTPIKLPKLALGDPSQVVNINSVDFLLNTFSGNMTAQPKDDVNLSVLWAQRVAWEATPTTSGVDIVKIWYTKCQEALHYAGWTIPNPDSASIDTSTVKESFNKVMLDLAQHYLSPGALALLTKSIENMQKLEVGSERKSKTFQLAIAQLGVAARAKDITSMDIGYLLYEGKDEATSTLGFTLPDKYIKFSAVDYARRQRVCKGAQRDFGQSQPTHGGVRCRCRTQLSVAVWCRPLSHVLNMSLKSCFV